MKIISRNTIDDYIYIAEYVSKQNSPKTNIWTLVFAYCIAVNVICFPALLLLMEYFATGIVVFLITLLVAVFFYEKGNKVHIQKFYKNMFGDEKEMVFDLELFENGIKCKGYDGCESFVPWNNIKSLENTSETIFLFTKSSGIPCNKNSFESENQIQEFLIFAKSRIPQQLLG